MNGVMYLFLFAQGNRSIMEDVATGKNSKSGEMVVALAFRYAVNLFEPVYYVCIYNYVHLCLSDADGAQDSAFQTEPADGVRLVQLFHPWLWRHCRTRYMRWGLFVYATLVTLTV